MTNSEAKENALKLIDEIIELTNEETIRNFIDEPIERALACCNFELKDPVTYKAFIHFTGKFLKHLYKRIPCCLQKQSHDQACAEAMHILEAGYQGSHAKGFYAAFLDARNPLLNGFEFVLFQLSEIIKARLRMRYTRWVYATRIDTMNWATRHWIAETLIERWEPFLPPSILGCSPAQLADHLPELISILHTTDEVVRNIVGYVDYYD